MSVPRAVKHTLVALARPRDFEVVRRNQRGFDRLAFAEHLRRQFGRLKIGCVLDVGANRGQYRDFLRDTVGYTGRIVSFEPITDLATSLSERAAAEDPEWEVRQYALGAAEEQRNLHVMRGTSYSSFFQPTDGALKARIATKNVVERVEPVTIRRLDDVVADVLLPDCGSIWLKVDTQGWDLKVLRGAARTLPSISGLQIELSLIPIYDGMPDYLMMLRELRRLGFEIGALTPVNRDTLGRVIELDCALVASSKRLQAHSIVERRHDYLIGSLNEALKGQRTSDGSSSARRRSTGISLRSSPRQMGERAGQDHHPKSRGAGHITPMLPRASSRLLRRCLRSLIPRVPRARGRRSPPAEALRLLQRLSPRKKKVNHNEH